MIVGTPVLSTSDTLAAQRTWLASERTLMAWIRTATSMLSFGFSIVKALQYAVQEGMLKGVHAEAPKSVGLFLIILAIALLTIASVQHWLFARSLPGTIGRTSRWDLALTTAMLLAILGLLTLANILLKVGPF